MKKQSQYDISLWFLFRGLLLLFLYANLIDLKATDGDILSGRLDFLLIGSRIVTLVSDRLLAYLCCCI